MQLPKPLGNNVLVEITKEHSGVSRSGEGESQKKGRLIAFNIEPYHLTASAAIKFDKDFLDLKAKQLQGMLDNGQFVQWEEFANEGQGFTHEGKSYASVAWWRLTSTELAEPAPQAPEQNMAERK